MNLFDILIIAAVVGAAVAACVYVWKNKGTCGGDCAACRFRDYGCPEQEKDACLLKPSRPEKKDGYPDCAVCRFRDECQGKKVQFMDSIPK